MTTPPPDDDVAEVRVQDLVGRRIRSERRVEFLDCDSYRHLSAAGFLRFAIDHRFTGTHDELGLASLDTEERTGIGWPIVRSEMDFLAEARLGDRVAVESWIDQLFSSRVTVQIRITDLDSGQLCCRVVLTLLALDMEERRAVPIPDTLPILRRVDLDALPWGEGHPRTP